MPKKDLIKAYHEAGHAVVARVLGVGVIYAAIFSTSPGNEGNVRTITASWKAPDDDLPAKLAALGKDLAVALGGPLAEHRHRPVKRSAREPSRWGSDMTRAINFAIMSVLLNDGTISPAHPGLRGRRDEGEAPVERNEAQNVEAARLLERSLKETGALVAQHWSAIERVANALLSGRMLDQDELDALIANRHALWKRTLGISRPDAPN
jgi:ATP-dependent Zn protease